MSRRAAHAVVLLGLVAGCGHTEASSAMLRAPQPRTDHVELYLASQAPPQRPYYEIALVQAVGFGSDATPEDVTRALTEKAKSIGCDAVVRAAIDVGYSRANAAGVCVKYLAGGPPGPPAVLPSAPPPNPPPPPVRPAPAPRVEPLPSSPDGRR